MKNFRVRIKNLREARGLTIEQLIINAKITRPMDKVAFLMIRAWESGLGKLSNSMLIKLAQYFNVSVDYLLGESN